MPGSWAPNVEGDGVDGKIAGVAAIRAHDPAFEEDVFLGEVQRRFFAVLAAWTNQKPELSQGLVAAQLWEEQKAQIEGYAQQRWRNCLDRLSFTSAIVAGALSENGYDTVTVRINASSADYDVDAAGRVIHGDTRPWDWTEDWIFQRPSSLRTTAIGAGAASTCANCGAPLDSVQTVCPYCRAAVNTGSFGWLLTRIDRL